MLAHPGSNKVVLNARVHSKLLLFMLNDPVELVGTDTVTLPTVMGLRIAR